MCISSGHNRQRQPWGRKSCKENLKDHRHRNRPGESEAPPESRCATVSKKLLLHILCFLDDKPFLLRHPAAECCSRSLSPGQQSANFGPSEPVPLGSPSHTMAAESVPAVKESHCANPGLAWGGKKAETWRVGVRDLQGPSSLFLLHLTTMNAL